MAQAAITKPTEIKVNVFSEKHHVNGGKILEKHEYTFTYEGKPHRFTEFISNGNQVSKKEYLHNRQGAKWNGADVSRLVNIEYVIAIIDRSLVPENIKKEYFDLTLRREMYYDSDTSIVNYTKEELKAIYETTIKQ